MLRSFSPNWRPIWKIVEGERDGRRISRLMESSTIGVSVYLLFSSPKGKRRRSVLTLGWSSNSGIKGGPFRSPPSPDLQLPSLPSVPHLCHSNSDLLHHSSLSSPSQLSPISPSFHLLFIPPSSPSSRLSFDRPLQDNPSSPPVLVIVTPCS